MIPFNYTEFVDGLTLLVQNGTIPMSRVDDAVRRILRVKFTMGLFENPYADTGLAGELGKQEHRDLAREAVRKSLVLLKNGKPGDRPLLPLPKKATLTTSAASAAAGPSSGRASRGTTSPPGPPSSTASSAPSGPRAPTSSTPRAPTPASSSGAKVGSTTPLSS